MKPSQDLFNLVHSLSKFEKRYVTLFLSSGFYKDNKNSLVLFRVISRQKTYDETSLKKQVSTSIATRLSAEKNKLFDLVLESMLFLYRDSIPEKKIMRERQRSWFLFQKGLKPLGWKYFHRTRELAERYEAQPILALLAYQENAETRLSSAESGLFSSAAFHSRDENIIRSLEEDLVLHTLFTGMIDVQKKYGEYSPAADKELKEIMQHPIVALSYPLRTFSARMSRFELHSLYYSMKGDHAMAFESYAQQVAALESSEIHIRQAYVRYCNSLSNQLMHAALARRYEEISPLVEKLLRANRGILDYFTYDIVYNELVGIRLFELIAMKSQADTNTGPTLLAQLEKMFAHYRPQLRDTLVVGFLFLFGVYHFYLGNRKKALSHLNDLIDSTSSETGSNYQCMARLVRLVIFSEQGDEELLHSQCLSVQRYLGKAGKLGAYEKALLRFLQQPVSARSKTELQQFHATTERLAPGSYSYGSWCDFEFSSWLESLLKRKPIAVLIASRPGSRK